ncbi:MAG: HAD-IC family P-type ATPase [Gammaproteobacteria bacterium]|nr:MAG: HAD-IC family P-type ATPase [Gammaproteobacteria bacterium]
MTPAVIAAIRAGTAIPTAEDITRTIVPEAPSAAARPWHTLPAEAVLRRLDAEASGLAPDEAARRLAAAGPNRLPRTPAPTPAAILLRQFRSPLIYLLLGAAGLALATGAVKDALFILAALLINAVLGAVQEARADRSSRALQQLLQLRAIVVRAGEALGIPAEQLVAGDVIELEPGARVPADARLLATQGLEIDESLLTGESLPVAKSADWTGAEATPLAERRNLAHAGTLVVRGRARAVVVATGSATAVGRLALAVMGTPPGEPPLMQRLSAFSGRIGAAVVIAALAVAGLGVLLRGYGGVEMAIFAIALAVSAIPEGLPVALTVVLAVCTRRMAQRGVIVRRLAAVEGLGSCTLIASDKTGTLTCNEITVREAVLADGSCFSVSGEGFAPEGEVRRHDATAEGAGERRHAALLELARAVALCNEGQLSRRNGAWAWHGDPTDVALLAFAGKLGLQREAALQAQPQLGSTPFEPEARYAATLHAAGPQAELLVKGAPERVAAMCADPGAAASLLAAAEAMARRGQRVLAVAAGMLPAGTVLPPAAPAGLRLLGVVGMIDPPRPGVTEAIRVAAGAGVRTIMVTGDHPVTALAIARDLGLATGASEVVTGAELAAAGPEGLPALMARARVFARVAPEEKLAIVQAAQAAGHCVAVTGDGVNDAPALRAADIGVAMGRGGTDVAREAAELVITDDHYATITAGIEEGRIAYANIRKVIYLLVSTGAAEVLFVALAVATGAPLPLTPVQLLWLNLATNGIQDMALGFERGEPGILGRPPRPPGEGIFDALMIRQSAVAALVMGLAGFAVFHGLLDAGWSLDAARNALLLLMVLFENLHLLNCRSETASAFSMPLARSPVLLAGAAGALLLHLAMMYSPIGREVLHTAPLPLQAWAGLLAVASSIVVAMEIHKALWRRRGLRQRVRD